MLIFDIQVINLQYLVQAWNCNATSLCIGPEKTLENRCNNNGSPRRSVRTTMSSLVLVLKFLRLYTRKKKT